MQLIQRLENLLKIKGVLDQILYPEKNIQLHVQIVICPEIMINKF